MSNETSVQQRVRLALSDIGPNWRNNSGVLMDERGVPVRFGLNNESKQQNEYAKSGDVISIVPVTAFLASTQQWHTLGVFGNFECKHSDWVYRESDKRAVAQNRFHDIVRAAGGFAGFVRDPADINGLIRRW